MGDTKLEGQTPTPEPGPTVISSPEPTPSLSPEPLISTSQSVPEPHTEESPILAAPILSTQYGGDYQPPVSHSDSDTSSLTNEYAQHTQVATPEAQPAAAPADIINSTTINTEEPRRMSDLLARTEPPAEPVATSEPAPIIPQAEGVQRVADLKAERNLILQSSLGDLTQADRGKLTRIDNDLASLSTGNEPVPPYLGSPQGWDAEAPIVTTPAVSNTAQVQAAEPISPISHSPEPVLAAGPRPGIVDRFKSLFAGRKTQSSGI
jgi:hypothetical protein